MYDPKELKTTEDIARKAMYLIEETITDADTLKTLNTLIHAAIARAKHETLAKIISDATHGQNNVKHLH